MYLDESGDDGDISVSSSHFFVVAVVLSGDDEIGPEILKLKQIFKSDKFKWNTLFKKQKNDFLLYVDESKYKVYGIYINKNNFKNIDKVYLKMVIKIFTDIGIDKAKVFYTGDHLAKMFDKVRRSFKSKRKRIVFIKAENSNLKGVDLADLWAGYFNYGLKGKIKFLNKSNIKLIEFNE